MATVLWFLLFIVSGKTEHMKSFHRGFACMIILLNFGVRSCVCVHRVHDDNWQTGGGDGDSGTEWMNSLNVRTGITLSPTTILEFTSKIASWSVLLVYRFNKNECVSCHLRNYAHVKSDRFLLSTNKCKPHIKHLTRCRNSSLFLTRIVWKHIHMCVAVASHNMMVYF